MDTAVYASSPDAHQRLADLGLEEEFLLEAVRRGLLAWASCTANHPLAFPGLAQWAETVCALREALIPRGWERSEDGGLALTVNASGTVVISVATGDESTGRADRHPTTKSSKGPRTIQMVKSNIFQMSFFPQANAMPKTLSLSTDRMGWLLLFHRDLAARELRCELSLPVNVSDDGHVDGWHERIILSATPFDDDEAEVSSDDGPVAPVVDIEIKKRA